jgi:hypothetical protein
MEAKMTGMHRHAPNVLLNAGQHSAGCEIGDGNVDMHENNICNRKCVVSAYEYDYWGARRIASFDFAGLAVWKS